MYKMLSIFIALDEMKLGHMYKAHQFSMYAGEQKI